MFLPQGAGHSVDPTDINMAQCISLQASCLAPAEVGSERALGNRSLQGDRNTGVTHMRYTRGVRKGRASDSPICLSGLRLLHRGAHLHTHHPPSDLTCASVLPGQEEEEEEREATGIDFR